MRRNSRLTWAAANELITAHTQEVRSPSLCSRPLVSVWMTTYNHQDFVVEAIESVLAQRTDFPFELVIGDDCSTDGTTDIVLEFQRDNPDKILVLLATDNLGKHTGNGRLNCVRVLRACRGKYIAFLEGDDYWTSPQKLQSQIDFLETHAEFAGSFHDTDIRRESDAGHTERWRQYSEKLNFSLSDTSAVWSPFHTSAFVVRSCHLEHLPELFLHCQSGDLVLFILAAAQGPLRRIPECMSVYRKHDKGYTASPETKGVRLHLHRIEMHEALKQHFGGVGAAHFDSVIEFHQKYVVQHRSSWLKYARTAIRKGVRLLRRIDIRRRPRTPDDVRHETN